MNEIPVDPNAVIAGLLDRLSAAQLEAVQLRVVLGSMESEMAALRATQPQTQAETAPGHNLHPVVEGEAS